MQRSSWSVSSDRVAESCRRREISARNFSQDLVPVKTSSCVRDVDTNGVAEVLTSTALFTDEPAGLGS